MTMKDLLTTMAYDDFGLARLLQALECLNQSLVTTENLSNFFNDLHQHWATSGKTWSAAWDEVSRGEASNVHGKRGYVRQTLHHKKCAPPAETFTTVVGEDTWQKWHLIDKFEYLADAGLAIPSFPIGRDPQAAKDFQTLTSNKDWARPSTSNSGAWLGRPSKQNANCWVSSECIAQGEPRETTFFTAQQDMAARGMVAAAPNLAAVRYHIAPEALPSSDEDDPKFGCRPGLADCGSVWFRVNSNCMTAERHRSHGWGSTVNLDKLNDIDTDTGLPERVIRSIPVDSPAVTRLELLPPEPVNSSRQVPDQKRFVERLQSEQSVTDIIEKMLNALSPKPNPYGANA